MNLKNSGDSTGFETMTSAMPVQCSKLMGSNPVESPEFFRFMRQLLKVTANLFGLEFCKILKSYHKIAHYIYFVLKEKLFENVFFLRSYCKFCVLRD